MTSPNRTGAAHAGNFWRLAAAVAVGTGLTLAVGCSDEDPITVALIPAEDPGPDPFMDSVVSVDLEDLQAPEDPAEQEATTATTGPADEVALVSVANGGDAGLYRGSSEPLCDPEALADTLAGDDTLAAAWAEAAGIPADETERHISRLAPVVLDTDSVVANHGWRDGEVTSFTSVLQAGTPVLVDDQGVPRVQCSCGNPLGPPALGDDDRILLEGESWPGLDPDDLQVIEPAGEALDSLTVNDIETGEPLAQPVGETELDGFLAYGPDGIAVLGEDGTLTKVFSEPVSAAADDGQGGVIFTYDAGTAIPTDRISGSIWRLPAGGREPEPLIEADNPPRDWVGLHGTVEFGGALMLAYEEMREGGSDVVSGDLHLFDLDSQERTQVGEHTSGYEHGVNSVSADEDLMQWIIGYHFEKETQAVDTQLASVDPPWNPYLNHFACTADSACATNLEFLGGGEFLLLRPDYSRGAFMLERWADPGDSEPLWRTSLTPPGESAIPTDLSVSDGVGLVSGSPDAPQPSISVAFDAQTGERLQSFWIDWHLTRLHSPVLRPAATVSVEETVETGLGPDPVPAGQCPQPAELERLLRQELRTLSPERSELSVSGELECSDGWATAELAFGGAPSAWGVGAWRQGPESWQFVHAAPSHYSLCRAAAAQGLPGCEAVLAEHPALAEVYEIARAFADAWMAGDTDTVASLSDPDSTFQLDWVELPPEIPGIECQDRTDRYQCDLYAPHLGHDYYLLIDPSHEVSWVGSLPRSASPW